MVPELTNGERPFLVDPDLVQLFLDLTETSYNALVMAIMIQRIAHLATKIKSLNLAMSELFGLFPFVDARNLRKNIYSLRKYGIWKNKPYRPKSGMAAYTNIRISWPAIAKLARKVQTQKQKEEMKAMCRRLNGE